MGGYRHGVKHRIDAGPSEFKYVDCTAPSAEEYIAELQASLEASGDVTAEMLARMTEQSAVLAEALRTIEGFREKAAAVFGEIVA